MNIPTQIVIYCELSKYFASGVNFKIFFTNRSLLIVVALSNLQGRFAFSELRTQIKVALRNILTWTAYVKLSL